MRMHLKQGNNIVCTFLVISLKVGPEKGRLL